MRLQKALDIARGITPISRMLFKPRFSQFAEDELFLILFNPRPHGFYVDVGAYHPHEGSNTYRLYLHGWRGITIEPDPSAAKKFRKVRPRDRHVTEGVASSRGSLEYFRFQNGTLNTFSSSRAKFLSSCGHVAHKSQMVSCRPLGEILDEHCPTETAIDLLSVDCEDLDLDVLQSVDLHRHRPIAIMVEDFGALYSLRDRSEASAIAQYLAKTVTTQSPKLSLRRSMWQTIGAYWRSAAWQ